MTAIFARLLTLSCGLMLAPEAEGNLAHDHDALNARCPISLCYCTLRDGFGGRFGEKVYECSYGHLIVIKK